MSALSITFDIVLLFGGSYLWMRYFSWSRRGDRSPRRVMSPRDWIVSVVGMVMMIASLSSISHGILGLLGIAPGASGAASDGSMTFVRVAVGSLFSGLTAGLACLAMRRLITRREIASPTEEHAEYVNDAAG